MTRAPVLPLNMAKDIKARLWEGDKTTDIGADMGISQSTVSNIKTGKQYFDVNWPDGSNGGMPEYRRLQLLKGRQRDSRTAVRLGANNALDDMAYLNKLAIESGYANWAAVQDMMAEKRFQEQQAKIDAMAEEVRLRHANNPPSPPPSRPVKDPYNGPFNPDGADKHTWDYVMAVAPTIPIVAVADNENDMATKYAIQILFRQLKPSMWNEPSTLGLIIRLAERIRLHLDDQRPDNVIPLHVKTT